jgi:hypothetical protein
MCDDQAWISSETKRALTDLALAEWAGDVESMVTAHPALADKSLLQQLDHEIDDIERTGRDGGDRQPPPRAGARHGDGRIHPKIRT